MPTQNQRLQLPPGAVRVPDTLNLSGVKLWCEYAIWGLLFYDDQSPWLTMVECLHICLDRQRRGLPIFEDEEADAADRAHESVRYGTPLNHALRHLLFRDRDILQIADGPSDDRAMWKEWLDRLERDRITIDFRYLQERFRSFRDLAHSVELLRSAEIESHTAKRWTSRHLLPLGSAMLFPDVDEANKLDRKFMRRTGEMLYLMLNRARDRGPLSGLISERLLTASGPWDGLAQRLAGPDLGALVETTVGYLPLPRHSVYDQLAADWIALLELRSIPVENMLDTLERVSGLLQALYVVKRAQETIGEDAPLPPFFLDLVGAPGGNPVRKLSIDQYKRHRTMLMDAMSRFVEDFADSENWQKVLESVAGAKEAFDLLRQRFRWAPPRPDDPHRMPSADQQLAELRAETQASRGHFIGSTFLNHVRQIGMLRAHRRAGTWYAPNDAFLEALVLTVVRSPMEFGEFLQTLHARYNIVVGPEEVRLAFRVTTGSLPAPLADLKDNERRLEERLRVLGFLDRKSDDCAFVINPFYVSQPSPTGAAARVPA
ncbi:hypothetical protein [Mesorhizobium sp.]|uniref:hypothetical protein n=1 Tax=Mesorhizobium sp. TaxID=1871066 RepID=UPI000FE5587C|nr:hypothetical protein [Mesorhizobium sp.]RWI63455.1 MAG: hypothetical protein EOR18_31425 [Mesorhizobium sp.]